MPHVLADNVIAVLARVNTGLNPIVPRSSRSFRGPRCRHFESYAQFQTYVDCWSKCCFRRVQIGGTYGRIIVPTLSFACATFQRGLLLLPGALFQANYASCTGSLTVILAFASTIAVDTREQMAGVRYGLDAAAGPWQAERGSVKDLIRELLDFVDEVVDPLDSRKRSKIFIRCLNGELRR